MRDRDLYAQILGLSAPWTVIEVKLDVEAGEVEVHCASDGAGGGQDSGRSAVGGGQIEPTPVPPGC